MSVQQTFCLQCASPIEPLAPICIQCGFIADQSDQTLVLQDQTFKKTGHSSDTAMNTQSTSRNNENMSHFKIVDFLGKGGMGAVYKAKDLTLERFVAIKMIVIDENQQNLIIEEAKTVSKINHPNIVTIYDISREQGAGFIVMEWIEGQTLRNLIPTKGLSLQTTLTYMLQIVAALDAAHQKNIIHRDIKPENIMVNDSNNIKVLDFGISTLTPSQQSANSQGTPAYMSPEQIKGDPTDQRSDLFSLGIVLYEMLTGVKPFLDINKQKLAQKITTGQYTPIGELKPDLPEAVVKCVDKLLQPQINNRYQNAKTLYKVIEALNKQLNKNPNWWQRQHWSIKSLTTIPIIIMLSWNLTSVISPPSTQELIERQLLESKKIAFLPFDNISGDPVLQIFSDGIAAMISSDLTQIGHRQGDGTHWILPSSELRKIDKLNVEKLYNKYGVDIIITGSIQHMGSTRRINLSLINGIDGRVLKAVPLSIKADKLFGAQTQIRQSVIDILNWQIPTDLNAAFAAQQPNLDGAYKHYLEGQGYLYRFDHANNITKAIDSFKAAIELESDYGDAIAGLAQAQLRYFIESKASNKLVAMANTVNQLEHINNSHPLLNYLQGELAFHQGRIQHAVKLFHQSIQFQPNFTRSYIGLANTYVQLDKTIDAEKVLFNAYQLMPNSGEIIANLGAFYFRNGNYNKAIEYFTIQAEKAPNNYTAYLNISACHYLNGDIQQAIQAAEHSLTLKENANVYANIGTYHFILKNYQQSVTAYEKMIALSDTDYIKWGNLADAYRYANQNKYIDAYKRAIKLAEQAVQVNPKNKNAIASLAYYYANLNDKEKTNYYAKQITQQDLGSHNFLITAAYAQLNLFDAAFEHLKFALNKNYSIAEIQSSSLLDNLKTDFRFSQMVNPNSNEL